ncbi:MAG: hypothetical protein HYZ29_04790 [Myxococcales bacterium]|nr:hypothetical protein [Myxococcales bacterium]
MVFANGLSLGHLPVTLRELTSLALSRHRSSFSRLLDGVRRFEGDRADLHSLLEVQRGLTRSISRVERRIKLLKTTVADIRETVRHHRLTREEARAAKQREVHVREEIKDYQWLLFAFRTIGDALAFLIFDRWDLKPLAFREPSGALTGKKGARLESTITRALIQRGEPAIRSDLTNVIRYGDVAVPIHGFPFFLEAKSGRSRSARDARQLDAMKKISAYLVTDSTEGLYGMPWRVDRVEANLPEAHHAESLNELIARSKTEGVSVADVEPGVRYMVARHWEETTLALLMDGMVKPLLFELNEAKNAADWTGYYPFTLSIRAPSDVFDFLRDALVVLVVVDIARVQALLRGKGYEAEFTKGAYSWVCHSIGGDHSVTPLLVSRHLFGRVAFEFLSLSTLLDETVRMPERKAAEWVGEPEMRAAT